MEKQQITRIPLKYLPILQTLGYENVWKIFINILWWNVELNDTEKIYFDLIFTDTNAIDKRAWDWNKGWRPQKKPKVIKNKKPKVEENWNLSSTSIDSTSIDSVIDKKEKEEVLEKVIEFWNSKVLLSKYKIQDFKQLPKINIPTQNLKDTFKVKLKEVWKDAIALWINNYCNDIENRRQDEKWYYNHRRDLYTFLKQSNWLLAYINK